MKKLFLNLNILNFLIISNISLIACEKHDDTSSNTVNDKIYYMGGTKDFDLKNFTTVDFQMLANNEISKKKYSSSNLENEIKNKVLDTIFKEIVGSKTDFSIELKALKEINWQIINIKFELINKNQQLKIIIEVNKWENIERFFKFTAFPDPNHRLIKGLAELGLNNVKKYYDHIKSNEVECTIEYGDKTFYHSIESAKKILEEDNKSNIDNYQFYMELDPLHLKSCVKEQLNYHLKQLLKNQSAVEATVVDFKDRDTSKLELTNDLVDRAIDVNRIKLEFNQPYQTVIRITDKNGYSEYVPIKFQLKNLEHLIERIKQFDFSQINPEQNQVSELSFRVEKYIGETFKEAESMQITVNILNEQQGNTLKDNEYTLNVKIQQVNFQIKWRIHLFNKFADDVKKIEQNLVLPSNFYAGINTEAEISWEIAQNLKHFYDNAKFNVYVTSELLKDENNVKEYNKYRNSFSYDISKLADFDSRKILAPVKYLVKIKISSKNTSWLSKIIERTVLIVGKP